MIKALAAAVLISLAAMNTGAVAAEKMKAFKLKSLDGQQRTLADVLGKTTLVVFFFPTCPYCNAAFPSVQKLHDTYRDDGLSVVWINVVPDEERLITGWLAKHGYTVPVLLGGRSTQNDYRLTTTPTHYILDAGGVMISRHAGYKPGDERELERQIRRALGLET